MTSKQVALVGVVVGILVGLVLLLAVGQADASDKTYHQCTGTEIVGSCADKCMEGYTLVGTKCEVIPPSAPPQPAPEAPPIPEETPPVDYPEFEGK